MGPQAMGESVPGTLTSESPGAVDESAQEGIADEEVETEDVTEETPELKYPSIPTKPDEAEVEKHRKTHWPYRSWCECCNQGRGLGEQRGRSKNGEHDIPIIGVDYFFITGEGVKTKKELEYADGAEGEASIEESRQKGSIIKCVMIRDFATKCVFGHVIPCKGIDEDSYTVKLVASAITWLGHTKIILKSDGEPAILVLVKKALEVLKTSVDDLVGASPEQSHPHDSQSNGGTEVGIRLLRGMFRTHKLCLEKRLGRRIPVEHPMMTWLLEHVGLVMNAVSLGPDGKTPWRRARGRDFNMSLYGFGEQVFFKQDPKGPQHDSRGNMGPRMLPGTFLGYNKFSNSYRVLTESGEVVKARALNSRNFQERWNKEVLAGITATPWSLRRREAPKAVELGDRVVEHDKPKDPLPSNPRRLKITLQTLREYKLTEGCPQCEHVKQFGESKPGLAHTEACRKRILEAMVQSTAGQARLEKHEEKIDRAIAERIRISDEAQVPATSATPAAITSSTSAASRTAASSRGGDPEAQPQATEDRDPDAQTQELPTDQQDVDDMDQEVKAQSENSNDAEDEEMIGMVTTVEDEYMNLLATLGVQSKSFRRETKKAFKRIVTEI